MVALPYDCCERCIAGKGKAAGCVATVYVGPPGPTTGVCHYGNGSVNKTATD
eukprot:gene13222-4852_t